MSNKTGFCRIFLDLPLLPSIGQTGASIHSPGPWRVRGIELEAVTYGLVIAAGIVAFAVLLVARARRRDQRDRDQMRAHVRRLGGPFDPGM